MPPKVHHELYSIDKLMRPPPILIFFLLLLLFMLGFKKNTHQTKSGYTHYQLAQFHSIDTALNLAETKLMGTLKELSFNSELHPGHTVRGTGRWDTEYMKRSEWTSGFFSGSLWYMYQITGEEQWREFATSWTEDLTGAATISYDHDTGFRIFSSFGNGYRLMENRHYFRTLLRGASTLADRYNPEIGAIKSWDWIGNFPVIIDNLINLELLFWAAKSIDMEEWFEMARSHAELSLLHHMRPDGSSYHIVDFNNNGSVSRKFTTQGCDQSASGCGPVSVWARGQAWAIYGFTMIYRYTGEQQFLNAAIDASNYFINNLPADYIPFYDFHEPNRSVRTKDTSAAAIAASGFFELYTFTNDEKFFNTAVEIMESLTSDTYSSINSTSNSILQQSTIHRGKGNVGTSYADYYYLEAIVRYLLITDSQFPEIETKSIFYLEQNYPNPFNNSTNIYFSIQSEGVVNLSVYDINGRKIQTLENRFLPSGSYRSVFNAGSHPSGVYFYTLNVNGERIAKKMTLLK